MGFDLGAGLSQMGETVAKLSGTALLEEMKNGLEMEKLTLANELAAKREAQGRAEDQTNKLAQIDITQKFQGGENEKQRAAGIEERKISAGATLGAAAISARSHVEGYKVKGEYDLKQEIIKGENALKVAETMAGAKRDIAKTMVDFKASSQSKNLLSPEAIEIAAETELATGQASQLGIGNTANRTAIGNKKAELAKERGISAEDLAANKVNYESIVPALKQLEKQGQALSGFAEAARANGEMLLELADKVDDTGVTVLNKWIRAGRKATGDVDVAKFDAVMVSYVQERAKILSGSMGNQAPTDAARHEVQMMMNNALTRAQIAEVEVVMGYETGNRLNAIQRQRELMISRIKEGANKSTDSGEPRKESVDPINALKPSNPGGAAALPMSSDGKVDKSKLRDGFEYNINGLPYKFDAANGKMVPVQIKKH